MSAVTKYVLGCNDGVSSSCLLKSLESCMDVCMCFVSGCMKCVMYLAKLSDGLSMADEMGRSGMFCLCVFGLP